MSDVELCYRNQRYRVVVRRPGSCARLEDLDRAGREGEMNEQPVFGTRGTFRHLSASIMHPPTAVEIAEPEEERSAATFIPRGTRLFRLTWDNSRVRTHDPQKNDPRVAIGCHFATGLVALDNGSTFETLSEMQHMLGLHGKYSIEWEAR